MTLGPKFHLVAGFADSVMNFRGHLIGALVRRGVSTVAVVPDALSPRDRNALAALGASSTTQPMRRTGTNPFGDLLYAARLYLLFRKERPQFVLAYTAKPVIYATLAASLAGVPKRFALITGLGFAFTGQRSGLLPRVVAQMYRMALKRASKVFFQNPDDEKQFRDHGLLHPGVPSVVVNGSGVDVASFSVAPMPSGAPVFLMICRLLADKGVREYVRAAQLVRARHPDVRFQLVGWIDGKPDAISQSELDGWVAAGSIEFLGKLEDVRGAIAQSSVYVLPSYREGTPRTVLEAMAMGRPIITTDAPGCRETVVEGENGYLVPVGEVEPLARAMLRFVEDPGLVEEMGSRSREMAVEKYDVHKVNALMLREMGISGPRETEIAS